MESTNKIYTNIKLFHHCDFPLEINEYITNRFERGYTHFHVKKYELKTEDHPFFDEDERESSLLHNSLVDFLLQNDCQEKEIILINYDW